MTSLRRVLRLSFISFFLLSSASPAEAQESWWETLAGSLWPGLKQDDRQLVELRSQIDLLPGPAGGIPTRPCGARSAQSSVPDEPQWFQIGLGSAWPVDGIILVPAVTESLETAGAAFPEKFRVDLSDSPAFSRYEVLVEWEKDPGGLTAAPLLFHTPGKMGSYVRITALRMPGHPDGGYSFEIGEAMVISGSRNIAANQPVTASNPVPASSDWRITALTDGRSWWGTPTMGEDLTNGYHSEVSRRPDWAKWIEIDLGKPYPVEDVRLIPARPGDFPDTVGFGFPERFRVEYQGADDQEDFQELHNQSASDFPNPGSNPVVIAAGGREARRIRVIAGRLWERRQYGQTGDYVFAIGEIEVHSGGKNVALQKKVTASDTIEGARWSTAFAVDGMYSRPGLGSLTDWMEGIARRHSLTADLRRIEARRESSLKEMRRLGGWLAGGVAAVSVCLAALGIYRGKLRQTRRIEALRLRIASDLHDEIGSNLGSIALLSQLQERRREEPDTRAAFGEIHRTASQSLDAMRDIVWLIHPGHDSLEEFVSRLRETADGMLHGVNVSFQSPDHLPSPPLPLDFRRHCFLAFKEVLHNLIRHAAATDAVITFTLSGRQILLTIRDNGRGFDPAAAVHGHGLDNIRRRLAAVDGSVEFSSSPGGGTAVALRIPLPRSSRILS